MAEVSLGNEHRSTKVISKPWIEARRGAMDSATLRTQIPFRIGSQLARDIIPTLQRLNPMLAGSLLIGFTVILVAVWLEYTDSISAGILAQRDSGRSGSGGQGTQFSDAKLPEARYQSLRRRWRLVIHALLALCGALMVAAGWAGPGRFWIAAWTAVAILMLCIVILALGDALRTHHHQARRLSQVRDAMKNKVDGGR
jgi:hypothetical protein